MTAGRTAPLCPIPELKGLNASPLGLLGLDRVSVIDWPQAMLRPPPRSLDRHQQRGLETRQSQRTVTFPCLAWPMRRPNLVRQGCAVECAGRLTTTLELPQRACELEVGGGGKTCLGLERGNAVQERLACLRNGCAGIKSQDGGRGG